MHETQMMMWADVSNLAWKWCTLFLPTFHRSRHSPVTSFNSKGTDKYDLIVCPAGKGFG